MWAWFTEMDVQSISNGPAMEFARVKWEKSINLILIRYGLLLGGLDGAVDYHFTTMSGLSSMTKIKNASVFLPDQG